MTAERGRTTPPEAPGSPFSLPAPFPVLPSAERDRSRRQTLDAHPDPSADLWIFGYGSLMWRPDFEPLEAARARLEGWSRRFCVWTALARGTPALPGLSLGLAPGGTCEGVAYRLAEARGETDLARLWEREMWTDIYRPRWVRVSLDARSVPAIAFVTDPASRQFAGTLPFDRQVWHIARAAGERGTCRDYLSRTIDQLRALGIQEPELLALERAVAAFAGEGAAETEPVDGRPDGREQTD